MKRLAIIVLSALVIMSCSQKKDDANSQKGDTLEETTDIMMSPEDIPDGEFDETYSALEDSAIKINGIYYTLNRNKRTARVSCPSNNERTYTGHINIPRTITYNDTTYVVKSVGTAFSYQDSLISITLPSSIIYIGENAFSHCGNLKKVVLPNTLKAIGPYAFDNTDLSQINLPNSLREIGICAFVGCKFTQIELPNSLKYIDSGAFGDCTNLTIISIPNSVKYIAAATFLGCENLKSVHLPESLNGIGEDAFAFCTHLTDINIPSTVKSIEDKAFYSCTNLDCLFVPNSVKQIGEGAFYGCKNKAGIHLPSSMKNKSKIFRVGEEGPLDLGTLQCAYMFGNNEGRGEIEGFEDYEDN